MEKEKKEKTQKSNIKSFIVFVIIIAILAGGGYFIYCKFIVKKPTKEAIETYAGTYQSYEADQPTLRQMIVLNEDGTGSFFDLVNSNDQSVSNMDEVDIELSYKLGLSGHWVQTDTGFKIITVYDTKPLCFVKVQNKVYYVGHEEDIEPCLKAINEVLTRPDPRDENKYDNAIFNNFVKIK